MWGKFINAGQTCIAPDYILVDRRIKGEFLQALQNTIHQFFGADPAQSPDFARIIHDRHVDRLLALLDQALLDQAGSNHPRVLVAGDHDRSQRYIAPTVLDQVTWDNPLMETEIFGPILPILEYDQLDQAIAQINARPKPLALYVFSNDRQFQDQVQRTTYSGGMVINDTLV